MEVTVNVFLKEGVLDPQGKAVQRALHSLNFHKVSKVRIAKQIKIELDENDKEKAKKEVMRMCEELLINSVIEDYELIL